MAIRAILHLTGEEAILCEMDAIPDPQDNFITVHNPRRKDGKPLPTLEESATSVVYPWTRISFIEFFETTGQREQVVGFFRESEVRRVR